MHVVQQNCLPKSFQSSQACLTPGRPIPSRRPFPVVAPRPSAIGNFIDAPEPEFLADELEAPQVPWEEQASHVCHMCKGYNRWPSQCLRVPLAIAKLQDVAGNQVPPVRVPYRRLRIVHWCTCAPICLPFQVLN